MTTLQRVLKNSLAGSSSLALGALVNFVTMAILGRQMGPGSFGSYNTILAFVGVFQLVAELGQRNLPASKVFVGGGTRIHGSSLQYCVRPEPFPKAIRVPNGSVCKRFRKPAVRQRFAKPGGSQPWAVPNVTSTIA